MKPSRFRNLLAGACALLGAATLILGLLLGYATRSIFRSETFADRVAESLTEPGVSAFVAGKIADGVIAAQPDLTGLRPLVVAGGRSVVGSAPFRAAARRAALEAHRAIMSGAYEKAMLSVQDVGEILKTTLAMHPEMARKLPRRLSARLGAIHDLPAGELAARLVRLGFRARLTFLALVIVGIALLVTSVMLAQDRSRTVFRIGAAFASAAIIVWLVARFGGIVIASLARDRDMGLLAAGLWNAFMGDLRGWAVWFGLVGIVCASASASLHERSWVEQRVRAWWGGLVASPRSRARQLVRGLIVLGAGTFTLAWPLLALQVVALLAGLVASFLGLRECFAATLRTLQAIERPLEGAAAGRRWNAAQTAAVGVLALGITAIATIGVVRSRPAAPEASLVTACNGYPELCDRRLDQVVLPATHNSMGGADNPGWLFPNQNRSIPAQLEDGVRAFLIDVHYGTSVGEKVKTHLEDEKAAMVKYEAALGKEGMAAALRIRDRLVGEDEKRRAVYMAHGFCELGAQPFTEALGEVRDFLVAHPGEILVFVIQDEGVAPQDIAACFEKSGLIDFVYRGSAKAPWPTLRQMAESDQRVVVLAENETGGIPWYHQAFDVLQETPYSFHDTTEFTEGPHRGGTSGSLLLLNHWIETTPMPKPSNAEVVNAYDFLLERARRFKRIRGRLPNLVAVDFYATGDLMRVVQTLNGVGADGQPPPGPR